MIWVPLALALALAVWAAVRSVRDQPMVTRQLIAGGVIEAALLIQIVVVIVAVTVGDHGAGVTLWGYLIVALVMMPAAAVVAMVERTRWSSVALIIACVTVAVMQLRIHQLWIGAL